jgi:hypothetical protein
MLCESWPSVVSFGIPFQTYLKESSIPVELRPDIINSLIRAVERICNTEIESGQQSNAVNAVASVINNLNTVPFDSSANQQLIEFITKMDRVKGVDASDYSEFLAQLLQQKIS